MPQQTVFGKIIDFADSVGASDIHIGAKSRPAVRANGEITFVPDTSPLSADGMQTVVSHLLNPSEQESFSTNNEINTVTTYQDKRLRIHAYHDSNGVQLALRPIVKQLPSYEELNLPPVLKNVVSSTEHGLILVAGPTGAGKTSTRTALLEHLNQTQKKLIISLSDSVEYKLDNEQSLIRQRTVGPTGHSPSYASALASALREDPDIISIGDLRDRESIETALSAAQSGHLVIAEVHASSTIRTLSRLLSHFPAGDREAVRDDIARNLVAAITQRLFPRIDTEQGELILATEVLINNDAIKNLIREGRLSAIQDVIRSGRDDGMHTLEDHVQHLADAGAISGEAVASVTSVE